MSAFWLLGMAYRTEEAYLGGIRRYVCANRNRSPGECVAVEIERFFTQLAAERRGSVSTQNQALSALLFLYRQDLNVESSWVDSFQRARHPQYLPVVLSEA